MIDYREPGGYSLPCAKGGVCEADGGIVILSNTVFDGPPSDEVITKMQKAKPRFRHCFAMSWHYAAGLFRVSFSGK